MTNQNKPNEQFQRLNPLSLTITQTKRYQAATAGADDKLLWEVIAGLSDEQIEHIKNGHSGVANLPYQDKLFVECDDGNHAQKAGRGLLLSHRITGDKYTAQYMVEPEIYLIALEGPEPNKDTPMMVIQGNGDLEWLSDPTQSMKNEMDMVMRQLKSAVQNATIDGRQWKEYMAAHHWKGVE